LFNQDKMESDDEAPAALQSSPLRVTAAVGNGAFPRSAEGGVATIHTGRPSKAALRRRAVATPEVILQHFNTWSFKREQPDSAQSMLQAVTTAVQLAQPVPFVLYWGKGPRSELAEPDNACLDYLASLGARLSQVYEPGASFRLILTDTHATLNGHTAQSMQSYFSGVGQAARLRGFDSCRLSDLVAAAEAAGAIDMSCEQVSGEVLQKLGACAAKWFRGEGSPLEGATRYFQMNMVEKQAVQLAFPRSIFVTFNGSEFRCLFPERMPIFYMYSMRRGTSVKPWFLSKPDIVVARSPAMAE
jgi:L-tyrosine isonitrile synthase